MPGKTPLLAATALAAIALAACDGGGPASTDGRPDPALAVSRLTQFEGRGTVGRDLLECADGGFLLLANCASESDLLMQNCIVRKIDADGEPVWTHQTETELYLTGFDLDACADGGSLVIGEYQDEVFGPSDAFLLKLDAGGTRDWLRRYGGELDEIPKTGVVCQDGGILVAGHRYSGLLDHVPWMMKTSASGDSLWALTLEDLPQGSIAAACACQDGGLLLGGSYPGAAFLWRCDAEGGQVWLRQYFTGLGGVINDLMALPGGDFAFTGVLSTGIGSGKLLMGRCSSEGAVRWYQALGSGFNTDVGTSLNAHPEGGFLVGGATSSYSHGDAAFWLLHFDVDGHLLWEESYETYSYNWCYSALPTSTGAYAATGFCTGADVINTLWFIRTEPYE